MLWNYKIVVQSYNQGYINLENRLIQTLSKGSETQNLYGRMAKITKTRNAECWRGVGTALTLRYCEGTK